MSDVIFVRVLLWENFIEIYEWCDICDSIIVRKLYQQLNENNIIIFIIIIII